MSTLGPIPRSTGRAWGIRMDGTGQGLEQLLRQHVSPLGAGDQYTLVEIGSAGCVSLRAFRDILAESCPTAWWRVVGFDLPLDKAWSVDLTEVERSLSGVDSAIVRDMVPADLPSQAQRMTLCLIDNPRTYISTVWSRPIHFVFIDASHGRSCALDFEAVERKVAPGGLVVFHDYGEAEQGSDWQEADRQFISVRSYVHRLGLNAPSPKGTLRKGWRWVCEVKGSRHWNGDGNSAAVVQRTNELLEHQPELSID